MVTILRGDPAGFSVPELRAAVLAGSRASAPFLKRLEADPRQGARSLAKALRRSERERMRAELMLCLERPHWDAGRRRVAGVDEAGMGPLAGPIVAAAVILSPDGPIPDAEDSKSLAAPDRERLAGEIRACAVAVAVGRAEVSDIAELDVYRAGLLAMSRAVAALGAAPDVLLVDARTIPGATCPQEAHVKGDARSRSIAAASIIAKTERDAIMAELSVLHPGYGFERHAGYAVPEHLEALKRLGPCAAHRTSWAALAEHSGELSDAFYELREALKAVADEREMQGWMRLAQSRSEDLPAGEVHRLDLLARRRRRFVADPASAGEPLPFGS